MTERPDSCPTCGSTERNLRNEIDTETECPPYLCDDRWHAPEPVPTHTEKESDLERYKQALHSIAACSDDGLAVDVACKVLGYTPERDPEQPEPAKRLMITKSGDIHEECPDCRGDCCRPLVCRNPNHALTDGSPSPHEIGPSCMAEPVPKETAAPTHWRKPYDFPDKDGEYLVYVEDDNRAEYRIGSFHRQTKDVGHWHPAWGIKGWQTLPKWSAGETVAAAPLSVSEAICIVHDILDHFKRTRDFGRTKDYGATLLLGAIERKLKNGKRSSS